MERRLAAILAADVAGYSRLMEADEAGTFDRLRAHRKELFEPEIAKHKGRVFKLMGDGLLAEFGSVVDAVECAVGLQHGMAERNEGVPQDRRIDVRIGVNLGDVIVEGEDRHGEGVNIAARLQQLAEPGGILVSETTYDHVRNKIKVGFEDWGVRSLKNVVEPVRVYRVTETLHAAAAAPKAATDRPSIAVLPFENLSGDPKQKYFSDGITEDLITDLSRFGQLSVFARHSIPEYGGMAIDVRRVGQDLGADYVVEGSVRIMAHRVRITARLVDAKSAKHLWAEQYNRDSESLFAVQDDVVRMIVGTLVGRLTAANIDRIKRKPPANLAAYDCVLRGDALQIGDEQAELEAHRLYTKAIELDPSYGRAYALLAISECVAWFRETSCSNARLDSALKLARKAVELDANDSVCWGALGWICLQCRMFDLAETYLQSALEMNPSNPVHVATYGDLLTYKGRAADAIEWYHQAGRLDRFRPSWHWRHLGIALFAARRYDDAIAAFDRSPIKPFWIYAYVAACHAQSGRIELARDATTEVLRLQPDFSLIRLSRKEPFKFQSDAEHLLEGLRKAGLPE